MSESGMVFNWHATRHWFVLLHRYAGLLMAGFLFVTGLTGAIISWDHEIDEWLNPHLFAAPVTGQVQSALSIVQEVEARHPQIQVTAVPLAVEPGHPYVFWVEPRVNPLSGRLFSPGFNQIFVAPVSGNELGQRAWGAVWPLGKENFVSFLYKLHFSLHIPAFLGTDRWGIWLLGAIALIWMADCFTGIVLTLPTVRIGSLSLQRTADGRSFLNRWAPSWKVHWRGSGYKLNFDLHRAASLWTWAMLFILALTAFSLNLYREAFFPAISFVSRVTPSPFELRSPSPPDQPISPKLGFTEALAIASTEAEHRHWDEPPGHIFYAREFGIYGIEFFKPDDSHGAGGVGHKTLYFDALDGSYQGQRLPWHGTAADIFVQAQFPLHSGRIAGLAGRIVVSLMGLLVALLSVTGVYIWWRKHQARSR